MTGQQLKNSILQWAIQGKLVPQDPTDEPASELLERIRTEKAQLIKEGKIKKGQPTSHIYRDDEGSYYEKVGSKDPVCINHEIPFDLPSGWEWCRLESISFIIGGFAFPSESIKGQVGTRVIRISDFNDQGWVDKNIVRYNGDRLLTQYEIRPYDIIMAMTGGTVGKSYYIDTLPERMYLNQRVAIIRLRKISPKYLNVVVKSPFIIDLISEIKNSTNDNISMKNMSNFLVPLPPLEEQKRIVARIEELMPLVEQYDKAHSELTRLNDQLPEQLKKSILQ
ncbi:restriction endonuclease subunit S, partial [Porphyromonas somerae]|uniref:restriction endonuclease subunit S n=1 Tax=Porphyromonas somerae TaxID=322095 RepID=UPI002A81FC6C